MGGFRVWHVGDQTNLKGEGCLIDILANEILEKKEHKGWLTANAYFPVMYLLT
ncbi:MULTISPECIES: hypothetical protein [Nitrosomonas]|uniref:hypothetical protein n=1 Tax=Nitrosomonas TaxID=914 RepID=UPI000A9B1363|nr:MULTISPECIES: hypothetical protein [Nitrosomonas]UVS60794.1 hypothetical protein NX761_15040 [Nitrosomonas sp. PLL12]